MPTSGGGTGTPIAVGPGGAIDHPLVEPLPRTHLSIHAYARIYGINPIHFSGARVTERFRNDLECSMLWSRYNWQQPNQASHEDLAYAILDAEKTIGDYLGYNVAPEWTIAEELPFPMYQNHRYTNMANLRGRRTGVIIPKGHIIAGGRRTATLIQADAAVAPADNDGDGWEEAAVVTAVVTEGTSPQRIAIFFPGTNGDPRWEIRPTRVSVSGTTATIRFHTYQLVDPDVHAQLPPKDEWRGVDITELANLVGAVDVYEVFNDPSQASAELLWEGVAPCLTVSTEFEYNSQTGFALVRNGDIGSVSPIPGVYADGAWGGATMVRGYSPDKVRLWYYSGYVSREYRQGWDVDPLSSKLAKAVADLATARLDRPVCECLNKTLKELQEDVAHVSPAGNFLAISDELQKAPFGTKKGEWYAYQHIKNMDRYMPVALF